MRSNTPIVVLTAAAIFAVLHIVVVSVPVVLSGGSGEAQAFSTAILDLPISWLLGPFPSGRAVLYGSSQVLYILVFGVGGTFMYAGIGAHQLPGPGLSLGPLLSGLLMVAVMLASPWVKLSLHASFAAFAGLLLWPFNLWYVALAGVATAGICWSRVALGRHTTAEVLGGGLLGGLFGGCSWLALRPHA